jgi:hypothetical protein
MQIIKSFFKLVFFVLPVSVSAQSTYLNQGSKEYHFIDRLEIKQQKNSDLNFSTLKPFSRKFIVQQAALYDSLRSGNPALQLTKVDEYNLRSLYMNNSEWFTGNSDDFASKKPVLKTFYKTKSNLFEVNNKDFFLAINPVIQISLGKESDYGERLFLNSRGLTIRGRIAGKIGFSSTITDNQERGPLFFQQQVRNYRAVPGVGFYKVFKSDLSAQDYFDARGYLTFNAAKFIDFQLGYDKNFIGNGYRSLFLSDWGNSYLFAKINTRIWKFNYQNLFMELMPQFKKSGDSLLRRKYSAMHHLSMNVTKWLNVGLFEGVMFGRKDHFDFQYLNPIIFYRHIEGTVGSPDNAVAGIDFKANAFKRFQFYGQWLLDEFILSKVRNSPTNWVNKFGFQLGGKYIDAFGIKNLDLQLEMNRVRPFTYAHSDTINNYTHYNQPMAHPLGANFQELIGIARYQPFPKWNIYARGIFYTQGLDSANANFGGNIFRSYNTRLTEDGYKVGSGLKATCFNAFVNVAYEFRQNLFFEASVQHRNFKLGGSSTNSTMISAGVRLNVFKREYNF